MTDPIGTSRRDFLRTGATVGGALATGLGFVPAAHAAGNDTIKVGLIGCGGRGTGALENICEAAGTTYNIKIHAVADAFADRANNCRNHIKEKQKEKVDIADDRVFVGFDAYKQLIECCDLILLATPPGFRPQHLEAAVKAGKNIFTEKPVGVDGPGIRKVLAAYEEAQKKKLSIVAGTQRRHQAGYIESMKRVHDGEIGDLTGAHIYWNGGAIWNNQRQAGWNDMEYQMRNWYHFTWLCGDHIVEQHVHNLDVACWALNAHPVKAVALGGRAGIIEGVSQKFDHFAVDYEWPNGVQVASYCRQINGTDNNVSETLVGTKGRWYSGGYRFTTGGRIRNRNEVNPYVQEHIDLLEAITTGKQINELKQVAESTMSAILGRMAAYSGKSVTWEQALDSKLDSFPKTLAWGPLPAPEGLAIPGITEAF